MPATLCTAVSYGSSSDLPVERSTQSFCLAHSRRSGCRKTQPEPGSMPCRCREKACWIDDLTHSCVEFLVLIVLKVRELNLDGLWRVTVYNGVPLGVAALLQNQFKERYSCKRQARTRKWRKWHRKWAKTEKKEESLENVSWIVEMDPKRFETKSYS